MSAAEPAGRAKPTVQALGIDVSTQEWHRSGPGHGAIEVAVVGLAPVPGELTAAAGTGTAEWVLMRVCGDPAQRVLVYDRHEWECFLDGVRGGEFDAAAS